MLYKKPLIPVHHLTGHIYANEYIADLQFPLLAVVVSGGNRKRRKGFSLVWLAFVWGLWRMRNDRIFNNKVTTTDEVIDYIQRTSWQWYLSNVAKGSCLFYEWVWNLGDCMLR
jgi:hypothetical protein